MSRRPGAGVTLARLSSVVSFWPRVLFFGSSGHQGNRSQSSGRCGSGGPCIKTQIEQSPNADNCNRVTRASARTPPRKGHDCAHLPALGAERLGGLRVSGGVAEKRNRGRRGRLAATPAWDERRRHRRSSEASTGISRRRVASPPARRLPAAFSRAAGDSGRDRTPVRHGGRARADEGQQPRGACKQSPISRMLGKEDNTRATPCRRPVALEQRLRCRVTGDRGGFRRRGQSYSVAPTTRLHRTRGGGGGHRGRRRRRSRRLHMAARIADLRKFSVIDGVRIARRRKRSS